MRTPPRPKNKSVEWFHSLTSDQRKYFCKKYYPEKTHIGVLEMDKIYIAEKGENEINKI